MIKGEQNASRFVTQHEYVQVRGRWNPKTRSDRDDNYKTNMVYSQMSTLWRDEGSIAVAHLRADPEGRRRSDFWKAFLFVSHPLRKCSLCLIGSAFIGKFRLPDVSNMLNLPCNCRGRWQNRWARPLDRAVRLCFVWERWIRVPCRRSRWSRRWLRCLKQ